MGRVMLLAGCLAAGSGCAGTTTLQAPVSDALVEAEQRRQRELVVRTLASQQARLDDVAFPLLTSSVEICGDDVSTGIGVRWTNSSAYEPGDWRRAAVDGLGLTDTLTVLSVTSGGPAAEAGLGAGDRILTLDGGAAPPGRESLAFVRRALEGRTAPVAIGASGPGGSRTLEIRPVRLCAYQVSVGNSSEINAYADGERVVITTGMMRFADDPRAGRGRRTRDRPQRDGSYLGDALQRPVGRTRRCRARRTDGGRRRGQRRRPHSARRRRRGVPVLAGLRARGRLRGTLRPGPRGSRADPGSRVLAPHGRSPTRARSGSRPPIPRPPSGSSGSSRPSGRSRRSDATGVLCCRR